VQEAGWASGPVWTGAENLAPPGFDPRTVQPVGSRTVQVYILIFVTLSVFVHISVTVPVYSPISVTVSVLVHISVTVSVYIPISVTVLQFQLRMHGRSGCVLTVVCRGYEIEWTGLGMIRIRSQNIMRIA